MKKGKIIAAAVIVLILAGSWLWSGSYDDKNQEEIPDQIGEIANSEDANSDSQIIKSVDPDDLDTVSDAEVVPAVSEDNDTADEVADSNSTVSNPVATMEIDPDTGKDKYQTEPVPEGKPLPVESENVTIGTTVYNCTLSVRCDSILDNIDNMNKEKLELVPDDGVVFAEKTVSFYEGESVFNVLQREMKKAGIHMEFVNTPAYNSAYIEGINNLYEFDCGDLSGWMYRVNGWFPNYGCSRYQLQSGDNIEWIYTCDLGRDIGGDYAAGGK